MTVARRLPLAIVLAIAVAALIGVAAETASAHALLKSSEPTSGANLSASPSEILLMFTEPPDPTLSSVTILDANGRTVHQGSLEAVPGSPTELQIPVTTSLAKGVYTVSWRTVSRTDGHVTAGSFSFGIGRAPSATASGAAGAVSATPTPSPFAVAGRWMFFVGLALLVGVAAVGLFVTRAPVGRPWMLWAAWGLALVGLIAMTLAERSTIGVSLRELLDSSTGSAFIDRGIALAFLDGAIVAATIRPGRATLAWLGVFAASALLVHAIEGHADAPSSFRLANLADEWIHLVAIAAWVGGLPWLLLATRRAADASDETRSHRAELVRRFARLATVALAVTLVTGLLRGVDEVRGLRPLVSTSFGITLFVKAGLVVALVALGAVNHFRRVPRAEDERHARALRGTVGFEIGLAALVVLGAVVLSQLPPASTVAEASGPAGPSPLVVTGHDFATTTRLQLTVSPGTVGPDTFTAEITDFDTGRAVPARSVELGFTLPSRPDIAPSTLDLRHVGGATWRGSGSVLSVFGTYAVQATVQGATSGVTVPLTLRPKLPPEQISVSRASGQPTLYTISLPGGGTLQTYVDPGTAGPNAVHFTFFEPDGSETTIASARASKVPPGGASEPMKLIRFDEGHFAGNAALDAGSWIFQISATTSDGRSLDAYFRTEIGSA